MDTEAIDPQSIRNVTVVGDPDDTARIIRRLFRRCAETPSRAAATAGWTTDRIDHTIRLTELSSYAPVAALERAIRMADGVLAVMNAAVSSTPGLETALRVADDHQVARLCLVTGLDHRAADFERCVRTIAHTHGAVPLTLQVPHGIGTECAGALELIPMWTLDPRAAEYYGSHWRVAEAWYRHLVDIVTDLDATDSADLVHRCEIPPGLFHAHIGRLTRIGDAAPVLCDAGSDVAPLLHAISRYLPSPLQVCQPEHALDY